MDRDARLKRLRFRATHRGTKEADILIGGFVDAWADSAGEDELDLLEAMLEEQDVDIMAWALGTAVPPERFRGDLLKRLKSLNYIEHPE